MRVPRQTGTSILSVGVKAHRAREVTKETKILIDVVMGAIQDLTSTTDLLWQVDEEIVM